MALHKRLDPRFKRKGDGTLHTIVKVIANTSNYYERHKMAFRKKTLFEIVIGVIKKLKYTLIDKPGLNRLNKQWHETLNRR